MNKYVDKELLEEVFDAGFFIDQNYENISGADIAELLDVLPQEITYEGVRHYLNIIRYNPKYLVKYGDDVFNCADKSLPNALAKMILKLNKEGLL